MPFEVCSETVWMAAEDPCRYLNLSVCPLRENRKMCAGPAAGEERKGRIVGGRIIKTTMLE
jgi:hypothetical protein